MIGRPTIPYAALSLALLCGSVQQLYAYQAPEPGTIVTVVGTGRAGFSGDGGPASRATLHSPFGLTFDAAGNLFVAEVGNHAVRRVSVDGIITTVAGTGTPGYSGDGGLATEARLDQPSALAVDRAGSLWITDRYNHRVRKVGPDGRISTAVGSGPFGTSRSRGFSGDGGPAIDAQFDGSYGIALDSVGNLFMTDLFNDRVRKVSPDGIIATIAGSGPAGAGGYGGDGGPATEARLDGPFGLTVDALGNLFVAEFDNSRVRKISPEGIITTVAGSDVPGFSGDGGRATAAKLNRPTDVVVDSAGNLFIADWGNYRVRKVSPDGIITTVAGTGQPGFAGEGGPAVAARLRGPLGMAVDASGNLWISDSAYASGRKNDSLPPDERVVKVFGVAAPGLLDGQPSPDR
jgi:sugar lactone lactonase YvrE